MPAHVPDDQLQLADVPDPAAPWAAISTFGHRYHAYKVAGSLQRVAALSVEAHDAWTTDGALPSSLPRLRLALFHTVRATHGTAPDDDAQRWARALVGAIRDQLAS